MTTSVNNGVAAQLQENQDLTHMLNIHFICQHLAQVCTDSRSFTTYSSKRFWGCPYSIMLCAFFKNSSKRLNIFVKTALKMHDLKTLTTNKHKKVVRKVKKVVSIRWLSLQASVDWFHNEYFGLLETWTF